MFKKLYRNIYLPIVLLAVTLIAFIDVFSIIMITQTLKDAYSDIGRKRVSRALDSCELYISSVVASAYNLSLEREIIDELSSPSGRPLVNRLDNTCNYSLKIDAVCAYSVNGNIYTSSQVSIVPPLDELTQVDTIKNFIEGNATDAISFRTEHIADIYGGNFYPEEMGVVTCCRKVYDGDRVVGWIFADILPSNLYAYLFANGQFESAVAFIGFGDGFFDYAENTSRANLLTEKDGGYFKYRAQSEDGLFSITVFNSKKDYSRQLTVLISILLSVSAALVVGAFFAAKLTAKSVTRRLESLASKMNAQEIDKRQTD